MTDPAQEAPSASTHRAAALLAVIAVLLFVVVNALAVWDEATTHPWDVLNSDHFALGSMYYKATNPDLFSRDYILNTDDVFEYYTPSFLFLVRTASGLTDGDFLKALALLQGPILLGYLAASYLVFRHVAGNALIGLLISLATLAGLIALKDHWGVVGLENMLPRAVALPALMLATFTYLLAIDGGAKTRRLWLLTGLLVGLVANLHPPTGITFAPTLGVATLFVWGRTRRGYFWELALLVAGVVIASLPIVLNVFGNVSTGGAALDHRAFVEALEFRGAGFPFNQSVHGRIASIRPDLQLWIGILWLPMTLLSWYAMKLNERSWTAWPFFILQAVYTWIMIAHFEDNRVNILLIMLIFTGWRWSERDERREVRWFEFLASIIFVSYFLSVVLRAAWLTFELDSIATLVTQLPRGARLFVLPCAFIAARFAGLLWARWQTLPRVQVWIELLAVLYVAQIDDLAPSLVPVLLLFALRERIARWQREEPILFAACMGMSAQIAGAMLAGEVPLVVPLVALTAGVWTWVVQRFRLSRRWTLVGGAVLVLLAIGVLLGPMFNNAVNQNRGAAMVDQAVEHMRVFVEAGSVAYLILAVLAGCAAYFVLSRRAALRGIGPYVYTALIVIFGLQLLDVAGIAALAPDDETPPPYFVRLGDWSRDHTDTDALFLNRDLSGFDGAAFRFWSQRSILLSFKDLGVFLSSNLQDLPAQLDRWERITGLDNQAVLVEAADQSADYIIVAKGNVLPLPAVYRDAEFTIYRYAHPSGDPATVHDMNGGVMLRDWSISRTTVRACEILTLDTWWDIDDPDAAPLTLGAAVQGGGATLAAAEDTLPLSAPDPVFRSLPLAIPCEADPGSYTVALDLEPGALPPTELALATVTVE